ncbi:1373_t:CDS:2 [Acaulospora morrowiae]|uniref:1373_t:CDS:1 n=1 Tax=Acaulospora morrowiae TaxID=94023 RepID=A0A9N8ZYZ4_9GLOM|nr:1373_t:CDS:2 [Acaulospora morrowiae]
MRVPSNAIGAVQSHTHVSMEPCHSGSNGTSEIINSVAPRLIRFHIVRHSCLSYRSHVCDARMLIIAAGVKEKIIMQSRESFVYLMSTNLAHGSKEFGVSCLSLCMDWAYRMDKHANSIHTRRNVGKASG